MRFLIEIKKFEHQKFWEPNHHWLFRNKVMIRKCLVDYLDELVIKPQVWFFEE